jgi:MFS family permease
MLTPSLTPFSGVQFIFSYATTFFAAIGIDASFTISMVVAVVEVVGVLVSFLLVNRFGRRPLLLWTSVPMILNLFICGILGSIDPNNENAAIGKAIAAQIILFGELRRVSSALPQLTLL